MRELGEGGLGDELRLDPDDVALADARHLRRLREGRALALERLELLQQALLLGVVEAGADVADPLQPLGPVRRQHERAERPLAAALALRVADDHELLFAVRLELEPVARALAGQVLRVEPLAHDPLEPALLRRFVERLAVGEPLRELDRAVAAVEQLAQELAPLRERQLDHRLAVHLEQVEDVVDDRRARLSLLHRREARAPLVVERADLAVDDAVGRLQRLGQLLGDVGEALGVVLVLARAQLGLSAGDAGHDPVAVPLDLELPALAFRDLLRVGERGQHRRVLALRAGRGSAVVLLAEEEPVLLLAVEVGGDERPEPFELLAVQADGQPAVALLLDQLVGAGVPDLDRARAVLALRNLALEAAVVERVVLHVNGEVALADLERDALRHGPARERAVALEAEVVVEPPCVVALDDEDRLLALALAGERLGRLLAVALPLVLAQAHEAFLARLRPPDFFCVRSTDSRSAAIRSTTSPSVSSRGSGNGSPSAFAFRSSSNSLR